MLKKIRESKLDFNKKDVLISNEMKELLTKMITYDPNQRINYEMLFSHEFFNLKPL